MQESIDNESPLTPQDEAFHSIWNTYEQLHADSPATALHFLEDEKAKAVSKQDYLLAAGIRDLIIRHKA